jgi:hypothetical protein
MGQTTRMSEGNKVNKGLQASHPWQWSSSSSRWQPNVCASVPRDIEPRDAPDFATVCLLSTFVRELEYKKNTMSYDI